MDNIINLKKENFSKAQYGRVVDNTFTQLVETENTSSIPQISVQEFFKNYNDLFFIIPKFGNVNSHEYLVKTSGEYINFNQLNEDIQIFIDEITQLRQENLELQQQLLESKK